MIQEKLLSITEITQELDSGIATVKFILKRFSPWLPFEPIEGHHCYSRNTLPVIIKIMESLEAGMLPSEIDLELQTGSDPGREPKFLEQIDKDIQVSKDGLRLVKSMFHDFALQQERVAAAHEKRVAAEERKAAALEKRAEAEEKKAAAMDNIAHALQEMNLHRIHDSNARQTALQAAQVLALDESNPDRNLPDIQETEPIIDQSVLNQPVFDQPVPGQQEYPEIFDSPDPPIDLLEASDIQMDDLSELIDDEDVFLDDALIDPDDQLIKAKKETQVPEMDDLSLLLEDPTPVPDDLEDLDDLSALIDTVSTQDPLEPELPLDDLSLLIEENLIEENPSLNALELDDPLDNPSALISAPPSLKPDITPQENLKEYKAAVMKIILGLKTENLSAEETTRRLNQDGVQTISGKAQWSEKAISQIYNFIDAAG